MADPVKKAGDPVADEPLALEPSQAEINAWAERERARRQAWLSGPSDDERAEYAKHVRQRRLAETFDEGEHRLEEGMRQGLHYGREAQLAADLVKAGREWEEDTALPRARRRVPMDDEAS
jgi:hypothetical protein